MVRVRLSRAGGPSVVKPARTSLGALRSLSLTLMRFGSFRSSKKRSRNSSLVSVKVKSSWPSPSGLPWLPRPPPPPCGLGISSPTLYSSLPGST